MSNSSKGARDNRANQLNPRHPAYHQSRGAAPSAAEQLAERNRNTSSNAHYEAMSDASPDASRAPSDSSAVKPE